MKSKISWHYSFKVFRPPPSPTPPPLAKIWVNTASKLAKYSTMTTTFFFECQYVLKNYTLNPLTYGEGLIGPPFFQRPRSLETLFKKKFEKISIPLLGSHLCESILDLLQQHLCFLQFDFENYFPESGGPKGSCHMWSCVDLYHTSKQLYIWQAIFWTPTKWRGGMAAA